MQGQEALFSENMPLGQVVAHFMEQHPKAATIALTPGTPSPTPPDTSRPTAPGEPGGPRPTLCPLSQGLGCSFTDPLYSTGDAGEHGAAFPAKTTTPPPCSSPGREPPGPSEGAASWESPRSPGAASLGASASAAQEEPPQDPGGDQGGDPEAGGGSPGSTRKLYSCDRCPGNSGTSRGSGSTRGDTTTSCPASAPSRPRTCTCTSGSTGGLRHTGRSGRILTEVAEGWSPVWPTAPTRISSPSSRMMVFSSSHGQESIFTSAGVKDGRAFMAVNTVMAPSETATPEAMLPKAEGRQQEPGKMRARAAAARTQLFPHL
ncbi:hypothetical protein QTO34_009797 [Cnephaeus nilssonii]|uniref:Uncharacterized protein n=1 Tax=Cnephaeus nilssonii TaxID=3371016 RepID=A0AA40HF58_CNENI|nr:hypothetical protein QTO34_009797 [Eptesicus nilssonii]